MQETSIRRNPKRLKKLFTEIANSRRFKDSAGAGFGILPNPDKLLRSKSLRSKDWQDLLTDTHLSGAIEARKAAVLGMNFKIETEGSEDQFSAELIRDAFNSVNVYALIDDILDCLLYGYQPIEIVWDTVEIGGRLWVLPVKFTAIQPHFFQYDTEGKLRVNTNEFLLESAITEYELDYKVVVARNNPKANNPYGVSILTRCYWAINWKRAVRKFWSDFLERFGFPQIHVAYKPNRTTEEVTDVVTAISESLQDSVFAIPDDYVASMMDGASGGSSGIFAEFIAACDDEISKAVLGHTGAMRSEAGKLGNENVAVDSKLDKKMADIRLVEEVVSQIIARIYELNFPDIKKRAWFTLFEETHAAKERAELDQILYSLGVRFTPEYIASTYQIDEGLFTIEQPSQTPFGSMAFASPVADFAPDSKVLQSLSEDLVLQVMTEVNKAKSVEDALARVAAIYPKLDTSDFVAAVEKMYFASQVLGILTSEE